MIGDGLVSFECGSPVVGPIVLKEFVDQRFDSNIIAGKSELLLDDLDLGIFEGKLGHAFRGPDSLSDSPAMISDVQIPYLPALKNPRQRSNSFGTNLAQVTFRKDTKRVKCLSINKILE